MHFKGSIFSAPPDLEETIPQPNVDDQIATDQLINSGTCNDDLDLNLDGVGEIVTVGEDGIATVPTINAEEFARSHPNTTFHTEPEDAEVVVFLILALVHKVLSNCDATKCN